MENALASRQKDFYGNFFVAEIQEPHYHEDDLYGVVTYPKYEQPILVVFKKNYIAGITDAGGRELIFEKLTPLKQTARRDGEMYTHAAECVFLLTDEIKAGFAKFVHTQDQSVSLENLLRTFQNKPLNGLVIQHDSSDIEKQTFYDRCSIVLLTSFPNLAKIDCVCFNLDTPNPNEAEEMATHLKKMATLFPAQAEITKRDYEASRLIRELFFLIEEKEVFNMGDMVTHQFGPLIEILLQNFRKSQSDLAKFEKGIGLLTHMCKAAQLLDTNETSFRGTLDMKYLPDIFMSCPAWHFHAPNNDTSKILPFLSSLFGDNFGFISSAYNGNLNGFDTFVTDNGLDESFIDLVSQSSEIFDFLVLMAPHLDFGKPNGTRGTKPLLCGFFLDCKEYFFVLDTLSYPTFFTGLAENIANTTSHMEKSRTSFGDKSMKYVGKCGQKSIKVQPFLVELLQAFKENRLFSFLRDERSKI